MGRYFKTSLRNALLQAYIDHIGTAPTLEVRNADMPADTDSADAGTLLASFTLPSTWMSTPASGETSLAGTWSTTGAASGTAKHYRIKKAGVVYEQGPVTKAFRLTTITPAAAVNGNVLTFASTSAVAVNQAVSGIGVPAGCLVADKTSSTVILNKLLPAGLAIGSNVYFGDITGKLWMPETAIVLGGPCSVVIRRIVAQGG